MESENPVVTIFDLPVEDIVVPSIITKYLSIRDLFAFRACSLASQDLVDYVLGKLPAITITSWLTDENFFVITEKCWKVRKIVLEGLDWLTDRMLAKFLHNNPNLEELTINSCFRITSRGLRPLASTCRNLSVLNVPRIKFCDDFLVKIGRCNRRLRKVDFTNVRRFSPKHLQNFLQTQECLTVLDLRGARADIHASLYVISQTCQELEGLFIDGCFGVTEAAILYVTQKIHEKNFILFMMLLFLF